MCYGWGTCFHMYNKYSLNVSVEFLACDLESEEGKN